MSIVANLVEQTTTSTGTGNLTLAAVDARQTFAGAIGTGSSNTFPYIIMHKSADEWERGTGYMSDSTTLVRSTVHESSNANAAVNFSAGTKRVTNAMPADELVSKIKPVADRTALKALNTSVYTTAYLKEDGRQGIFEWDSAVPIATHTADVQETIYVAPDSGANGAWVLRTGNLLGSLTQAVFAATRTALAALSILVVRAYLGESGREGWFVRKSGSIPVTDDGEGIYVDSNTANFYWEREGAIDSGRFQASWFGIVAADSGAAALITDAIETIGDVGGGRLVFGPYLYYISETIYRYAHNVFLEGYAHSWHSNINTGAASRWSQFGGTIFLWTAGTASKMMIMRPRVGASEPALVGGGMDGIILDGAGVASHCLEILSLRGGRFPTLLVADAVTCNLHLGVVDSGDIAATEPRDTQHCQFDRILSRVWLSASLSAKGILIDGDDVADVSVCQFNEIEIIYKDGIGVDIHSSDACTFGTIFGFRIPGGTANGVKINGGVSSTDYPRRHVFHFMQPGPGGLNVVANTVAPVHNSVVVYSLGNGTPEPVVPQGCALPVHMYDQGNLTRQQADQTPAIHRQYRSDAIASGYVGYLEGRAWDSAGNLDKFTHIAHYVSDNTSTSEDSELRFGTFVGGTFGENFKVGNGATIGASGHEIKSCFYGSAALNFPSIAAQAYADLTMTVTGATAGSPVFLGPPSGGGFGGLTFTAFVSAANTVTVRAHNPTAGALDPTNATFTAVVFKMT